MHPLRIFQSHISRTKIHSRRKMKEIEPKFQNMFEITGNTLNFGKICAGGRHKITHVFAKILFPLWDKNTYLDLEICRMNFPKNLCFWSTRLGLSIHQKERKVNTKILRKVGKCEKEVFFWNPTLLTLWVFCKTECMNWLLCHKQSVRGHV